LRSATGNGVCWHFILLQKNSLARQSVNALTLQIAKRDTDRMIKNNYKDDYSRFLRLNRKGKVVPDISYLGDYYVLPFDEKQKKRTGICNLLGAGLLLAIQIAAGLMNPDSSRTFWIVYPYLFTLLPLAYMIAGAVRYFEVPLRMQKAHYETSIARIKHSCIGTMVLAGISAVLDIVYMLVHRGDFHVGRELCYFGCQVVCLLAAAAYGRYYDRTYGGITIEKSQNLAE
jgi:hypothetical protein